MNKIIECTFKSKKVEERNEMRKTLLRMNGKIIVKNGLESENLLPLYQMYSFYKPNPDLDKYPLRIDELVKEIKDLWLVEISVEDGLLRTKSIAETDNWILESVSKIFEKLERAWGACNFAMVNDYFGMEVIDMDRYKQ